MKPHRIVAVTPFEAPDARLAAALGRAGALAVLDLGRDREAAKHALVALERESPRGEFGVRVVAAPVVEPSALPARIGVVIVGAATEIARFRPRRVFVECATVAHARAAAALGADAIIAVGNESAGPAGDETGYVLLQRLVSAALGLPIYLRGGVGLHTAASAIAGGAAGVVLDSQLALLAESSASPAVRQQLAAMDGSETQLVDGRRQLLRHGAAAGGAPALIVGQDGAFARALADRFRTSANLVSGLEQAIDSHLRQASALSPLAPHSRWAKQHQLRFPIAQGPMTRVSDRAAFACAVADGGGLPFLALSLMRAKEARPLLEETRARLGSKSWGVGVLGFVPPELREEQLALLREFKPPVVLIAGGRPAHARPLEEAGIQTYLHVPSPGLLDIFIKEGARRFVLEGRECGGHVGPRSSFVLWESAIERLVNDPHAGEMSLLFAGGIHDARSAAMVAAASAPLAGRGARIGVLMGTAYLFTNEAVSSGAIQPGFQAEALACEETVLLDTGPGHSTRCAETDYVRAFRAERERLSAEGKDPREMWEALEKLNLGRLRTAAKGIVRDGEKLGEIGDAEQRKSGMYMMGQVAALRDRVLSIEELHQDVSEGGARALCAARDAIAPAAAMGAGNQRAPRVAIVGMASIFPGAPDLESFWRNIVTGQDAITEVPKERWNPAAYYDPAGTGDKTPSKWGGFLDEVAFDPASFGIPPRSLAAIEPVQLLALEVSRRALGDAGYLEREFERERTSVIFGAEAGTDLSAAYGFRASFRTLLGEMPQELDETLPKLTEDSFAGILTNVIAGRIANRLDLGGVNYTVDAACASSLAAVDLACKELAAGETDMVVCGGADLHNGIADYLMFASVHALSPTGRCRTFDATADGIALGEGVAALVLKRLEDAERDGDRIYAVIESVGGSSDGKSLGLTAPRKEGQTRALERAYRRAAVSPADVELVEAHGTGTVVGDRTELATLTEIFGGAGALPGQVTLGSVKSNIGHTKCAAGLAGIIKAALSIHRRVLPPTLHVQRPNPGWDAETSPFVFRERASPWSSSKRRAGVSAFGFGGTNFHAVLAEHAGDAVPESGLHDWPCELFLLRGKTRAEADALAAQLESIAQSGAAWRLRDLALSCERANTGAVRVAFVAKSLRELGERARRAQGLARSGEGVFVDDAGAVAGGKIAVLFPGQGSQKPGMLDELFVAFPWLQSALGAAGGEPLAKTIFPGAAFAPEIRAAQKASITDTRVAQPALGVADLAALRLLEACGVRGELLAGHSYGELVALCAAGTFDEATLLSISRARAQSILDAAAGAPGTMAAVKGGRAEVERALAGAPGTEGVVLANHNAPDQIVIAGPDAAVDAAVARLADQKIAARRIPVACAFHSPVVAAGAETFLRRLESVVFNTPDRPVFANSTAAPYPSEPAAIRQQLARQLAEPVRFAEELEAMYTAGARIFIEAGPGQVLSDLARRNLGARPFLSVAVDAGEGPLSSFLQALARLATAGVPLELGPLYAGRSAAALDLAQAPHGPPATAWMINGQTARPLRGSLPDFAMKLLPEPLRLTAGAGDQVPTAPLVDDRQTAVLDYLRNMRELVASQKEVMLRMLGTAPEPGAIDTTATVSESLAWQSSPPAPRQERASAALAAAPAPTASADARPPLEILTAIVSERTGYPADVLDPDLDLEAELGVDSIKRIEILGLLSERLGLGMKGGSSDLIEELSQVKTLRGIARWIEARAAGQAPALASEAASSAQAPQLSAAPSAERAQLAEDLSAVRRFVLRREPLPPAVSNGFHLEQRRFLITDDGLGVATHLSALLGQLGAHAEVVKTRPATLETPAAIDGVIHLGLLAAQASSEAGSPAPSTGEDPRAALYELARAAALGGAQWLLAVTGQSGAIGKVPAHGGVAALLKSVAREWPQLRCRAIDLDPSRPPELLAGLVLGELLAHGESVQVIHDEEGRATRRAVEAELEGAQQAPFNRGDVVLITGGGRGITAGAAVAIAERYGCTVELVGRSPLPAAEDAELAACADAPALRRLFLSRLPDAAPAKVEAAVQRALADRQIRATLSAIAKTGVAHRYHALDVRDAAAFGALIDDLYARHGRLDVVIHGAGVIEDKLLKHKTRESFDRVFETKVAGAAVLARKLRPGCRVVFFSSIAGVFGNRGQLDYAAANEALDHLAHHLAAGGRRAVSVAWGPWAGTGMVSPELEREYARRGVGLIPPAAGFERLFDELARGRDANVILMCSTPERLEG